MDKRRYVCSLNDFKAGSCLEHLNDEVAAIHDGTGNTRLVKLDGFSEYHFLEGNALTRGSLVAFDVELADFQYEYDLDMDIVSCINDIFDGKNAPASPNMHLIPSPLYARDPYPMKLSKHMFRTRSRRSEKKTNKSFTVSFKDNTVPLASDVANDSPVFSSLKGLFDVRTAWTKHALHCVMHLSVHQIDSFLHSISYTFSDGPWKNVWIRRGMDPRMDPSFVVYQSVELRSSRKYQSSLIKRRSIIAKHQALEAPPSDLAHEFHEASGVPPLSNLYQLCDIKCKPIQDILLAPSLSLSEADGWLPAGSMAAVRSYLKSKSRSATDDTQSSFFSENDSSSEDEFTVFE